MVNIFKIIDQRVKLFQRYVACAENLQVACALFAMIITNIIQIKCQESSLTYKSIKALRVKINCSYRSLSNDCKKGNVNSRFKNEIKYLWDVLVGKTKIQKIRSTRWWKILTKQKKFSLIQPYNRYFPKFSILDCLREAKQQIT